jgi:hypothetical protein
MEIFKRIDDLKKSIHDTDILLDELTLNLDVQLLKLEDREKTILKLKEEIQTNVKKIDEIIEVYNANS